MFDLIYCIWEFFIHIIDFDFYGRKCVTVVILKSLYIYNIYVLVIITDFGSVILCQTTLLFANQKFYKNVYFLLYFPLNLTRHSHA